MDEIRVFKRKPMLVQSNTVDGFENFELRHNDLYVNNGSTLRWRIEIGRLNFSF